MGRWHIKRVDCRALDVGLAAPFNISSSTLDTVNNVAIRLELDGGSVGWGEVAILPPITREDQPGARAALGRTTPTLVGRDARAWRALAGELAERLPALPAVRAGLEMALIDALVRACDLPLFHWLGGCGRRLTTDITIPICSTPAAEGLAASYRARGFDTLKTKIGGDVAADIERVRAIRRGHPQCRLVLDANEGYSVAEALAVLRDLRQAGIEPTLLEQPVAREDWEGLGRLAREAGVPIAADEACRTPRDALRIAREGLAQVINVKLAKCGVVEALEIAAIARAAGIALMIGGMVETRLAMGFAAHFAAGLGGFQWIDLDTPLLLSEDPVRGGYAADGPEITLDATVAGHGGALAW